MTDKQIRIDITSIDDASDVLDDVADRVDDLEQASPQVDVTADTDSAESDLDTVDELVEALDRRAAEVDVTADTDQAAKGIDDVDQAADELGRLTPEVTVDADTEQATRAIDDVDQATKDLSDADREIILKAKVSDATEALKSLRGGLDDTSKKADDVKADLDQIGTTGGPRLAGNTVSDLTGPLGDASGAAGDFGGVLDGLSDSAEFLGTKMGLTDQAVGNLTTGLGLAGVAVAGVAAGITYFAGKAEAAKKKQEELAAATRDLNAAIEEGDYRAAADQLTDMFEDAYDAAEDLGIPLGELTDYITGAADSIPTLDRKFRETRGELDRVKKASEGYYNQTGYMNDRLVKQQSELLGVDGKYQDLRKTVDGARRQLDDTNGVIATQNRRTHDVAKSLKEQTDETDDLTKANKKAQDSVEDLDQALSKLKDQLSFERTMLRFSEDFDAAFKKVNKGKDLTSEEILSLKEDVLDVAEFAKLNPAQVKALLRRIERGDIASVISLVQSYMDQHTVNTPAGVKYSGGAREARDEGQSDMNNQPPVQIPTEYQINWDSYYRATHPGNVNPGAALIPTAATAVTNVTMYLPRGYRENDAIAAGRRAARRSGGLYRRFHR